MRDTVDADMDDLEGEEVSERSRQGPELAVPVYSGGAGLEIQNLPDARKDLVEEQVRPMLVPRKVTEQVMSHNEGETAPEQEPMESGESAAPAVGVQAEGDLPAEAEMTEETRPAKTTPKPSVPGPESEGDKPRS